MPNHPPATTSSAEEHDAESIAIIDRVFLRLAAIYGNAWRKAYTNNEFLQFTKREWLDGLAGYEEQLLYRAVAANTSETERHFASKEKLSNQLTLRSQK